MRRHDGEWKWNVIQGGPLLDAQGEVESWVCTITEVEELVRVSVFPSPRCGIDL
jgi:PAS domain-containing protein